VTQFKKGDQVFAFTSAAFGCHAQYRTISEDGLIALKPANLSFEEAAALSFGGLTALSYLKCNGGVTRGDKVLIVGASGGVGTAAVQIAKHFGAEVTGVCSTANLELVRAMGADKVIDYTREDMAETGETYDIILDTTGSAPLSRCEQMLKDGGRLLVVLGTFGQALGIERPSRASRKKVVTRAAPARVEDMRLLAKMAEAGDFRPCIDRCYPLESAAMAHAYVETGRKRGNVVLTVQ
jgi:NADPH:quinone reductase-like Zn-dependent oxidoreductase